MKKYVIAVLCIALCCALLASCGTQTPKQAAPVSAEAFADRYFRATSQLAPGTAGSSLRQAQAEYEIVRFAADGDFANCDVPTMRDNMLAGWESLSADEQTQFDEAFYGEGMWSAINALFENYDEVKGVYEDAGVGDELAKLVKDENVKASWETLLANSFTMGNSES